MECLERAPEARPVGYGMIGWREGLLSQIVDQAWRHRSHRSLRDGSGLPITRHSCLATIIASLRDKLGRTCSAQSSTVFLANSHRLIRSGWLNMLVYDSHYPAPAGRSGLDLHGETTNYEPRDW